MLPLTTDVHDQFEEIKIHTAKCDSCNKHNKLIIYRCKKCGQQCCTPCWQRKGGDDNHILNGGDRGFAKGANEFEESTTELPAMQSGPGTSNARAVKKRKRLVRRRKTALEDEDKEDEDECQANETHGGSQGSRPKRIRYSLRRQVEPEQPFPISDSAPVRQPVSIAPESFPPYHHQHPRSRANPYSKLSPSLRAAADHLLFTAASACDPTPTPTPSPESFCPCAPDCNGLAVILLAAAHVEDSACSSPASNPVNLKGDDEHEQQQQQQQRSFECEEWGQDAQARSPLFVPEGIKSCSQETQTCDRIREAAHLQVRAARELESGIGGGSSASDRDEGSPLSPLCGGGESTSRDGEGNGGVRDKTVEEDMGWCYGMGKRDTNGVRGWR